MTKKTAARSAAQSVSGQLGKFVIQFGSLFILARVLSPADFGLVAVVMTVVGLAGLLTDFGFSLMTLQGKRPSHAVASNAFWINFGIGLVCAAALVAAAPVLAEFFDAPSATGVCRALALVVLAQSLAPQLRAEVARRGDFGKLAFIDVLAQLIASIVAIAVALIWQNVWALAVQQVVASWITLAMIAIISRWKPSWPTRVPMNGLLTRGGGAGGVQLVNYLSSNADTVLLGKYWGTDVVGQYNQAYQVFRLPVQQLLTPITTVALTVLSPSVGTERFNEKIGKAQLVVSYVLAICFAVSAGASEPMFRLLLGPGWDEVPMVYQALAIGGAFQTLSYVYYWIFLSTGRTGTQMAYSTISRVILVALLACSAWAGPLAVAIASSIGLALNWAILSIGIRHTGIAVGPLLKISVRPLILGLSLYASCRIASALLTPLGYLASLFIVLALAMGVTFAFTAIPGFRYDARNLIEQASRISQRRKK